MLTEATDLLDRVQGGTDACLAYFLAGGATLVPTSAKSLERCRTLMTKYRDQPMDLADATLVTLAEDLGATTVFTLDRRDFEVYRIRGRRRFRVLPDTACLIGRQGGVDNGRGIGRPRRAGGGQV
jgi:uncharacterized protein